MLDPNYLLHISEGAENIAEKLHSDIVKRIVNRIMLRIGRGEDYILTAQDKWQIENLQQAGYLLEDIQKDIAKATKLQQTEIAEAMEDAGVKALDYDDKIYQSVGLSPTPLTQSPELIRLMQRNYEATIHTWENFTRTMADEAQRLFINQLDMAYTLVSTGALSYTQAVKEVLNNIVSDGVTVEWKRLDKNGVPYVYHTDTIETATLRAVRTGISQATSQIQMARAEEMGVDKFIISSHLGARPSHQVWQGKVFTMDELKSTDDGMPALGTATGLSGINCRHSVSPWFDGMDNPFEQYDSEENRIQYEKEQRQRTLERRIRDTKRDVMAKKEAVDSCKDDKLKFQLDMEYQRKAALLKKQNVAYKDYCERNNLRPLADRIQIAKWDRQQAAAARGAAKRYENAKSNTEKKTTAKIIKPESIPELNAYMTNIFGRNYDRHRIENQLNLTPYDKLGEYSVHTINADFGKMSVESATAFSETLENLIDEYDTPLTKIRPITSSEFLYLKDSFAAVSHEYSVDSCEMVINVGKCKDYEKFVNRIKEISNDRFIAEIIPEKAHQYVATHEFAHTLLDMTNPLSNKRNFANANYEKLRNARKEVENVYKDYMKKLSELDSKVKEYDGKIFEFMMNGQDIPEDIEKMYNQYYDEYQRVLISEYSLENSDEFMAEAFTQAKIGIKQNEYSKRILEILDKNFKR